MPNRMFRLSPVALLLSLVFASVANAVAPDTGRVRDGLQVLYDFRDSDGNLVKDRSGAGKSIDLRIVDPRAVRRLTGSLEVRSATSIRSDEPPARLINAIARSGAMTIEAWIRTANDRQEGPARIVTLSKNANERNFTLGQDGDRVDVRLRTTSTSGNGIPSLTSPRGPLTTARKHVVYTRYRSGRTRIYVDGRQVAQGSAGGSMTNWNGSFQLALANELSNDRPWLGTYHLVAIYSRELSLEEVGRNFRAGTDVVPDAQLVEQQHMRRFESQVAPLLARRCLECHDSVAREGGLDLSRKRTALAGGDSGPAIVPGKSAESRLWESVASNDMPQDRQPLSDAEKALLRQWIDDGAHWSLSNIDAALYQTDVKEVQNWVRRLTVAEYIETVRSAVGVDIRDEAIRILPKDLRADGFSNTAYNLNVDLQHVEAYAKMAELIAGRIDVPKFAARFSRSRRLTDDDMRDLIAKMGKWLLRGPLEEHEIVTYRGISTTVASAGGDFDEAVRLVIEAMLQSPRFLYRMENQRGDGGVWQVSSFELASRLSYAIWGGPPDDELFRTAESGGLDRSGVAKQVQRMLQDPRTIDRSLQFIDQWLHLGRLENLRPSLEKFPDWDPQLASDMRQETLAFFREVIWEQRRPMADLLNAQVTYLTPRLAEHYGLKAVPPAENENGLVRHDLTSVPSRGGLLTQGSVLTIGGDEASMVTRGLFVLKDLLFSEVGDPPPGLDVTPVPSSPGRSQRAIAEMRIGNASCGGCHVRFEPLAFGLEKFDGLGTYHEKDEFGNALRDDGEIHFPGEDRPRIYRSAAELMDLLAESDRVKQCLTRKLAQFVLGRPLVATDAAALDEIHRSAQANGGTYTAVLTAIATSDLLFMTQTEATK